MIYKVALITDSKEESSRFETLLKGFQSFVEIDCFNSSLAFYNKLIEDYLPDLIIADVEISKISGVPLIQKVREFEKISYVPIMALTSRENKDEMIEVFRSGADFYILKKFDDDLIKAKVEAVFMISEFQIKRSFEKKNEHLNLILANIHHKINNHVTAGVGYLQKIKRNNTGLHVQDIDSSINNFKEISRKTEELLTLEKYFEEVYDNNKKVMKL